MGKVNMNITDELENSEVIEPEIKRVTLHPLTADGEIDLDVNLYPKTLVDGVVDRQGLPVDIATQQELDTAVHSLDTKIDTKQNIIPDLEDIRSKANTAVQPEDLAAVATTGSYHDLVDKPIIPEIPVADVLVNGESVVNDDTVAEINLKTINGEAINGEGNIEVVTDLSDYYTKEESDEVTDALDERVGTLEDQVLIYNYFYGISSPEIIPDDSDSDSEDETILGGEVIFPIYKTKYNLLEFSAKGRSDSYTDCYTDLLEPEVLGSGEKILSNSELITLYQTGKISEITTNPSRYGYDTFNVLEKKVYRYCYALTFRELFDLTGTSHWNFTKTTSGVARIQIDHSYLAEVGIATENGITQKYTRDIGLEYKGVGTRNFGIVNIETILPDISDVSTIIETLTSDTYADVKIIFKRTEVLVEDKSDIIVEIPAISCSGEFEIGISGFGGCVKASYLSLNALVYSKDQCDTKFQTIADFEAKFNPNQYILKIGDTSVDPTSSKYNQLEATLNIYSTVLKDLGYPKYACANCIAPEDPEVESAPYRGDTTFINAKNGNTYGYLVLSQGITYWVTRELVSEDTYKDVVKQISLDPNNIMLNGALAVINYPVSIEGNLWASNFFSNSINEVDNGTPIISYDDNQYYTTVSQVGKINAPSFSDFTILQLEDSQNPGEFSSIGDTVRLMNVADPIDNLDVANKQYVDNREVSWDEITNKPADNSNLRNSTVVGSLFQVAQFKEGLTWESNNTSVATVDENGHVEAISAGTATISVIDELGRAAECDVIVTAPAGRSLRKGGLRSANSTTWERVTGAITAGEYLIAYTKNGADYYMKPTNTTSSGNTTTSAGNYLANVFPISSDISMGFTFTDAGSSKFYIKDATCFVRANGTTNNGLASAKDNNTNPDYGIWTITETSTSGEYTIINNNSRQISLYLSDTVNNWRSYGNTSGSKTNVYLYKKVVPVESITINNNPETLTIGSTYQLNATVLPVDASDKSLTWHTSDDAIISIDSSGELTAEGLGTATIYASANDGSQVESDPITITVQEATEVTSISVAANPSSGVAGNTLALTATVQGSGPGYNAVNWSIDDPDIATITSTGANTANAVLTRIPGTATVTATSAVAGFESISGSATITNNQIWVSSITIDPATETNLTVGLTYPTGCTVEPSDATNPNVIWSTSDSSVATISNEIISALGVGTAVIKATAADGHTPIVEDSITVTVHEPLGSLYLDKEELNLTVGESYDLICSDHPINHADGVLSVALGSGSNATEDNQVVVGTYNEETDSLFIVGNGESEATRANAFEVTPEGKAIAGSATTSSDSGNTLVTKNYADSSYFAKTRLVSILTSDWSNSSFTHSLSPVIVGANDVLFVTPTDDCAQEYYNCGIQRTLSQDRSSITLTAATVPSSTITIQIVYFKGQVF